MSKKSYSSEKKHWRSFREMLFCFAVHAALLVCTATCGAPLAYGDPHACENLEVNVSQFYHAEEGVHFGSSQAKTFYIFHDKEQKKDKDFPRYREHLVSALERSAYMRPVAAPEDAQVLIYLRYHSHREPSPQEGPTHKEFDVLRHYLQVDFVSASTHRTLHEVLLNVRSKSEFSGVASCLFQAATLDMSRSHSLRVVKCHCDYKTYFNHQV